MVIHPNSKYLMIGALITGCDRARPVDEIYPGALRNSYVNLVSALLMASYTKCTRQRSRWTGCLSRGIQSEAPYWR